LLAAVATFDQLSGADAIQGVIGLDALLLLFDSSKQLPLTLLGRRATLTTMSAHGTVRMARMRELQVGTAMLQDVTAVVVGRNPTGQKTETAFCPSTGSTK